MDNLIFNSEAGQPAFFILCSLIYPLLSPDDSVPNRHGSWRFGYMSGPSRGTSPRVGTINTA